jgi:hypothetical protein
MKIIRLIPVFLIAASTVSAGELNQPPLGFTALFNGKNLDGWWGLKTEDPAKWMALDKAALAKKKAASIADINEHWSIDNGELVNDGHGMYLSTRKNYGDFELLVDYKTVAKADSGIYLRGIPQVQIWDTTKEGGKWGIGADKGSGGLWNNPKGDSGKDPLVLADKPFGQWNSFRIFMVGERVTIWLNGKLIVENARLNNFWDRKKPLGKQKPVIRRGPIELQTHGGEIRWRNVFIREIGGEEANQFLAHVNAKGFKNIFNGKDMTGWAGPVQNYVANQGVLSCKKGKGGTIYTKEEYGDFVVRMEVKIPMGGNNGLAIRYPGKGDTAYVGMCELQVLDNTAPGYAKLKPQQYHGSAYGMVPAHRGYLRKPGEWNYQEVTVKGSTIHVELNGVTILNTDLSKVEKPMAPIKKFKGRTRTKGHFGFAGHGAAVQFRNVRIKRLD